MKSATYQEGHIYEDKRRPGLWYVMYRVDGRQRKKALGRCGSEKNARKKAAPILLAVNEENTQTLERGMTFGELVKTYRKSDRFPTRFSTSAAYESYLKIQIVPKWGDKRLKEIKAVDVEAWLKDLKLAGKTKAHLKMLMYLLFQYAVHIEQWLELNPIRTVRVRGASKRLKMPLNLTSEQFHSLLPHLREPFRTMAITAMCLGLRFSEIVGLKWMDIDWMGSQLSIKRAVVNNHVDATKTEHSGKPVPIDSDLLEVWKRWRAQAEFKADDNWIFASPQQAEGEYPYCHQWARKELHAAAKKAGIPEFGWHSFRHSYRTWLDATGAPIGVQRRLMRHSDIRTTMNVYGDALTDAMKEAQSKIVGMALRQELRN